MTPDLLLKCWLLRSCHSVMLTAAEIGAAEACALPVVIEPTGSGALVYLQHPEGAMANPPDDEMIPAGVPPRKWLRVGEDGPPRAYHWQETTVEELRSSRLYWAEVLQYGGVLYRLAKIEGAPWGYGAVERAWEYTAEVTQEIASGRLPLMRKGAG